MSNPNLRLGVIEKDLYAVMYMLPDPVSRCLVTIPVARGRGREAAEVIKRVAQLLARYDEEASSRLPVRRGRARPGEARLVSKGRRGREPVYIMEIVLAPASVVNVVEQARYAIKSWLVRNGIVIHLKPANVYLIDAGSVNEFYSLVSRVRESKLRVASEALKSVWKDMVREVAALVSPVADGGWSVPEEPPRLDDVRVFLTMLKLKAMVQTVMSVPGVAEEIINSVRGVVEEMIQSILDEALKKVSSATTLQQAAQALSQLAEKARRFGLEPLAVELEAIASLALGKDAKVRDVEEMLRKRGERIIAEVGAAIASLRV